MSSELARARALSRAAQDLFQALAATRRRRTPAASRARCSIPSLATAHLALGKALVYLSDVVVGTPTRDLVALAEAVQTYSSATSELEPGRSRRDTCGWAAP